MAYTQKNNPFRKKPEEPIDGGTLPDAEVVVYTGTPREIRRKRRQYEGIGANWEIWKQKRNERLNRTRVDRSSELDTNPLSKKRKKKKRKKSKEPRKTTKGKGRNFRTTKEGAGMTEKGVREYRRKNPGSKLKTAVTGKVKPGSKAAKRRKSFCARSRGWTSERGKAARRRWKC